MFVLLGLLAVALLAIAKLAISLRRSPGRKIPWWSSGNTASDDEEDDFNPRGSGAFPLFGSSVGNGFSSANSSVATEGRSTSQVDAHSASSTSLDIDLDLSNPLLQEDATASIVSSSAKSSAVQVSMPASSPYQRDFSHSLNATLHAINTQEMLDVRQQADFFMTLGQHEEAISLLETSIRESDSSNPLVYIDLLNVLHTLSRKTAFDHYRNEFNSIFTGWAPQYSVFGQPGNSLDAYPQICAEISHVWGTESSLAFLEQCMVRSPEDAPEHYFDLDAFRDLLLLHAIAGRIGMNSTTDSGLMPFSAMRTGANSISGTVDAAESIAVNNHPTHESISPSEIATNVIDRIDVVESDNNLIDFDASGLSVPSPLQNLR